MKKIKSILAITAIVLLVGMYAITLFFALSSHPNSFGWFKASLSATVAVPVLIYAYSLLYRVLQKK